MRLKSLLILILSFARPSLRAVQGRIQGVVPRFQAPSSKAPPYPHKQRNNISKITETDSNAYTTFLSLAPGHYAITVEKSGFKKKSLEDLWFGRANPRRQHRFGSGRGHAIRDRQRPRLRPRATQRRTNQRELSDREIPDLPSMAATPPAPSSAPGVIRPMALTRMAAGSQNILLDSVGAGGSSVTSSIPKRRTSPKLMRAANAPSPTAIRSTGVRA